MFVSKYTGQTVVRYFPEEDLAVKYINMIIKYNKLDLNFT